MATEHVLTCHSVTRLSSIALLSTSGRVFKYRCVSILGRKISDCKSERANIMFLVKLKKSAMESFQLLTGAYGEDCMSRARVSEWNKRRSEGRETLKDESFEVQGNVDCFLRYPGYCDGRVDAQRRDGKTAVLH